MTRKFRVIAAALFFTCTATAGVAAQCPSLSGFDEFIANSKGVFVGELHGTEDTPEFLGDLLCNLVREGRSVAVGLEYPSAQQASLDEFLSSRVPLATHTLLEQPVWIAENRDGRSSRAFLELLHRVKQLVEDGGKIKVIAFDGFPNAESSTKDRFNARDRYMADVLTQRLNDSATHDFTVLFAGNVHARKSRGLTFPNSPPHMKNYEPLGYLVRDLGLLHLNVRARGGTLWACPTREQCGVQTMAVNGPDVEAVSIHLSAADPAFDGYYDVGLTKASPPAKPD